jgi:hypothetical protein
MRRLIAVITAATLVLGVVGVAMANGNGNGKNAFKASLGGYQEVPAISTTGTGSLKLTLNSAGTELAYTLTFSSLQGGNAAAAHIHFAQPGVNSGIVADLCGGTKPACPAAAAGTVSGVITSANVLALPAQGIAAGEFAEVLKAMSAGVTYANVHTAAFPGGEIRGQIGGNGKNGNDDD